MKVEDLKKGERYYYAKLNEYPIAFSFVLLGKTKYYGGDGNFYKLFYESPFRQNSICELIVIEDCDNFYKKFNKDNVAVLKVTDSMFISKDKALLAKEIKKYYRTKPPVYFKKYLKVIKELKETKL